MIQKTQTPIEKGGTDVDFIENINKNAFDEEAKRIQREIQRKKLNFSSDLYNFRRTLAFK